MKANIALLLDVVTAPLMRHLFALQQSLQKKQNLTGIVSAAVDYCKSAEKAILATVRERTALSNRPKTTIVLYYRQPASLSVLNALERAHPLLHQATNKVSESIAARKDCGRLEYQLVSLFERLLESLGRSCKVRADSMVISSIPPKKQKKTSKSAIAPREKLSNSHSHEVSNKLTKMLATMILSTNSAGSANRALLEGYLYVLLTQVGKLLCLFVFKDLQLNPDLRVDISKLPLPSGLMDSRTDDMSIQAAEFEARHLIWLLEQAMAFIKTSTAYRSVAKANEVLDSQHDLNMPLLSSVKTKLQNTLLKAVFGQDDPLFSTSLLRPVKLAENRFPHSPLDKPVSEWFTQEVWRLLGWEILAKDVVDES